MKLDLNDRPRILTGTQWHEISDGDKRYIKIASIHTQREIVLIYPATKIWKLVHEGFNIYEILNHPQLNKYSEETIHAVVESFYQLRLIESPGVLWKTE